MKHKCIIVDDEQFARKLLTNYIEKIPSLELVGAYRNALFAMEALEKETVDLMLLDIQMPELKGTDFLRILTKKPLVIFTTAYTEYALESYELDVVDYLVKPIPFNRFMQAIDKAKSQLNLTQSRDDEIIRSSKDFIILKSGPTTHKILFKDIYYIEALKEYVTYHTNKGRIVMLQSLKKLEHDLPNSFMRVHRSYIVNTSFIESITGNTFNLNGIAIPIGKTYLDLVKKKMFN